MVGETDGSELVVEKTTEAVGRVIAAMRENLGEPLTVDDMARTAMFSKFHFSHLFRRITGVSPGQLLSAMRLQEAKQLLVETSLTVTEISNLVGYTGVGTFSARFSRQVGVSPTTYRQLGGVVAATAADGSPATAAPAAVTVHGEVRSTESGRLGLIFVGLFTDPIPRGQPVRCTLLHRPGPYALADVPPGTWHVLAHSVAAGLEEAVRDPAAGDHALCIVAAGPVQVRPATRAVQLDLRLRPAGPQDPEVLRALLDVRSMALTLGTA